MFGRKPRIHALVLRPDGFIEEPPVKVDGHFVTDTSRKQNPRTWLAVADDFRRIIRRRVILLRSTHRDAVRFPWDSQEVVPDALVNQEVGSNFARIRSGAMVGMGRLKALNLINFALIIILLGFAITTAATGLPEAIRGFTGLFGRG